LQDSDLAPLDRLDTQRAEQSPGSRRLCVMT
jgi:hypothetical protein